MTKRRLAIGRTLEQAIAEIEPADAKRPLRIDRRLPEFAPRVGPARRPDGKQLFEGRYGEVISARMKLDDRLVMEPGEVDMRNQLRHMTGAVDFWELELIVSIPLRSALANGAAPFERGQVTFGIDERLGDWHATGIHVLAETICLGPESEDGYKYRYRLRIAGAGRVQRPMDSRRAIHLGD